MAAALFLLLPFLLFSPLFAVDEKSAHCEGLITEIGDTTMLSACMHNGTPIFDIRHFFIDKTKRPTIRG